MSPTQTLPLDLECVIAVIRTPRVLERRFGLSLLYVSASSIEKTFFASERLKDHEIFSKKWKDTLIRDLGKHKGQVSF